jgi:hypothetical protein
VKEVENKPLSIEPATGGLRDRRPTVRRDDSANKLTSPFTGDCATMLLEVRFWDRVDDITLAERRPVQAVLAVENDFVIFGGAPSPFGGTHDHFDRVFAGDTVRMGNYHARMRVRPIGRTPLENIELVHSSNAGSRPAMLDAAAFSNFSQTASSGNGSMAGMRTSLAFFSGLALFTSQTPLSKVSTVTSVPAGQLSGITNRRRPSIVAAFIMGIYPQTNGRASSTGPDEQIKELASN